MSDYDYYDYDDIDVRAERENRERPGSATESNVHVVCYSSAVAVFVLMTIALPHMPIDTNGWAMATGIMWVAMFMLFMTVGAWAQSERKRATASLADLMPQRMLCGIFMIITVAPVLLLTPA
ncbi:MAG TPA: hypothetical protein VJM32_05375 [Candidatus Saccharimonadales bacterium]|nr:hypothetical protein [Candidatus Saccharimonadales bacterium]